MTAKLISDTTLLTNLSPSNGSKFNHLNFLYSTLYAVYSMLKLRDVTYVRLRSDLSYVPLRYFLTYLDAKVNTLFIGPKK